MVTRAPCSDADSAPKADRPDVARARRLDGDPSPDEVRALFDRYRSGELRAREELVRQFMPLARRLARRFGAGREHSEDLEQVAYLGLVKAIDRYEAELGPFPRFAVPTILGELRRHLRDRSWTVQLPRSVHDAVMRVNATIEDLTAELGRAPGVAEIAERAGLTRAEAAEAVEAGRTHEPLRLESSAGGGSDDDELPTLAESLGGHDPHYGYVELGHAIAPAFRSLPEREQRILKLRLIDDLDQHEIAEAVGVSQMHVSRLLRASFRRLSQATVAGGDAA